MKCPAPLFGLILVMCTWGVHARVLVPLSHMPLRQCNGMVHANANYIDLYTPFYDCHRMPYVQVKKVNVRVDHLVDKDAPKIGHMPAWVFLMQERTRQCPFEVLVVTWPDVDADSYNRWVTGFHKRSDYVAYQQGIRPWSLPQDTLNCEAYDVNSYGKPEWIVPEKKRAPVVPRKPTPQHHPISTLNGVRQ
jgi:hypothetical protein